MITRKEFLNNMKENVSIEKENVPYIMLNGRRSKYDLIKVDIINGNNKISVNLSVDWSNKSSIEEMFKPRLFTDLIIPEDVTTQLKSWVKTKNIPNMIFYSRMGGTGKTSISQVMSVESNLVTKKISANINRGIEAVKEIMIPFCANTEQFGNKKLLCIEEIGDATTSQVDSLKSIIDTYNKNVSVILTTNTKKNLSQPLLTRVKTFDFNKIKSDDKKYLNKLTLMRIIGILEILNVEYSNSDVVFLCKKHVNSYREIMVELQTSIINNKLEIDETVSNSFNLSVILKAINDKEIDELSKVSETTNHIALIEYLEGNYLNHIDTNSIAPFIYSLNEFQKDLSMVAFHGIAFLAFCCNLIDNDVKFKVIE